MIIKHLKLTNFMNVSNADIYFQDGINVLTGPTGAGKSTVLEAISYCLLERRRGDSWEEYIKSKESFFEIELEIETDAPMYFKYRGEKKGNSSSTSKNIKYKKEEYNNSECKSFLDSHLDLGMIQSVVFTLQDSKPVSQLKPLERRDIFKNIFNSNYEDEVARIKKDLQVNAELISSFETQIEACKIQTFLPARLEMIDTKELDELLIKKDDLLEENDRLRNQLTIVKEIEIRLKAKSRMAEELTRTLQESINVEISSSRVLGSICQDEKALVQKREAILLLQRDAPKKERDLLESLEQHTSQKKALEDIKIAVAAQENSVNTAHVALLQLEQHLKTHKQGMCNECGQRCDPEDLPKIEEQVAQKDRELKAERESLRILEKEKLRLQNEERATDTLIRGIKQLIQEILSQIKEDTSNILRLEKNLESFQISVGELKEKRDRLQARASEITSQIAIEDAWLLENPVGVNSEMIVDVESRLQQVESRILESRKLLTINEEREKANKLLEVRKQENEETLKDLFAKLQTAQLYEKDLELTKSVYEVLLPNYKNSKACDTLRKYMNTFLSNTKESFEVQLESTKKGVEFQYRPQPTDEFMNAKMASGFETAILTLAFKAATASAYNSNLLVLDEPDKDADNDSSASFFEALLSINGGFQQTILISHREEGVKLLKDNGAKIFKVLQGTFTSY